MKASPSSGFQGEKSNTKRDLGAGSGQPTKAGTGFIEKSKSAPEARGSRGVPTDTGHSTGIAKMKGGSGDASRLKGDGVGGPLPSA